MGKGGYSGGSTLVGPGSGWFGEPDPRTERVHAVGRAEGEAARERLLNEERLQQEKIRKSNDKIANGLRRHTKKVEKARAALAAKEASGQPTKVLRSREETEALMAKVEVVRRPPRRVVKKP
jgi:hypothetical protein